MGQCSRKIRTDVSFHHHIQNPTDTDYMHIYFACTNKAALKFNQTNPKFKFVYNTEFKQNWSSNFDVVTCGWTNMAKVRGGFDVCPDRA
jgi:hypothetical protein